MRVTIVVSMVTTVLFAGVGARAEWWTGFAQPENAVNGVVLDICAYNDQLIVGGRLVYAGGNRVNRIAAWYDGSWHSVRGGVDDFDCPIFDPIRCLGIVDAVLQHDSLLFVGGQFPSVGGGIVSQGIAAWDGEAWQSMDGGVNGRVRTLAVHKGRLIVGGDFTMAGRVIANNVALWNGRSWEALGNGFDQRVLELTSYGGLLIAQGPFFRSGSTPITNMIAAWNGVSWEPFAPELGGTCPAAVEYDGDLLVAFHFGINGSGGGGVARWDGVSWSQLGQYMSCAQEIGVRGAELYLVGHGDGVDRWNGSAWEKLGDVEGDVNAITVYEGQIYIGGSFLRAGGRAAPYLSRWDAPTPTTLTDLRAVRVKDAVILSWRLDAIESDARLRVMRSASAEGPFAAVSDLLLPEEEMRFADATAPPGVDLWYGILASEPGSEQLLAPVVHVSASSRSVGLDLTITPGVATTRVEYSVPAFTPYRLQVFDPRGRLVAELAHGVGAGPQVVEWNHGRAGVASGIYFTALKARAGQVTRKITLVR